MRWLSNPVLLEWDESIPWCDAERQRSYQAFLRSMRRIAVRAVPMGAVLFAAGFWFIGRIPGGGGAIPYGWQLKFALPFLLPWSLPYVALRLGFGKPKGGTSVRVRFHAHGMQFVETNGAIKQVRWSSFDAFDFGWSNGFDILKLRLRGSWLSRRFGRQVAAIEVRATQVSDSSIRGVLRDRGLCEEPLGEPTI